MKKQKRILNEQATRKFMKLAGLQPLSENFFSSTLDEQEDELEDELPAEEPMGELPPEDLPPEELPPEEPMDVGPEGGDLDVHSLVDAIAAAIEQETGVTVDVEGDEAAGEEAPLPDEEEPAMEPPLDDEGGEDLGMDAPPEDEEPVLEMAHAEDEEDTLEESDDSLEEDAVDENFDKAGIVLEKDLDEDRLNEMTSRVAARILELAKKNK
jgi:hypothetical protein